MSDTATEQKGPIATRQQPHGGRLLPGGRRGNRGGAGAPPSAIRTRCRQAFADRVAIAERIADDDSVPPRDRLRAMELLARIGLGSLDAPITDDDATRAAVRAAGGSDFDCFAATFRSGMPSARAEPPSRNPR